MNYLSEISEIVQTQLAKFNGTWIRTPTVIQLENTECGAASLSIILQHYSKYVPLTQLRELCGISRDGSDAASLILAARSLGLRAKGFKKGISKLKETKLPVIIFWEFNHFLVLEGFIGNKVMLNDPALGPRTVTLEDFDNSYTGIVLTFSPDKEFQPGGKAPSIWPLIFNRLLYEPWPVLFITITGLILILPQLILPIFSQIYIDEIVNNNMKEWLKPMLIAMAITIIFQTILRNVQLLATRKLEKRLTKKFSANFQKKVLSLPEKFFTQRYAGDIAIRTNYNTIVSEFISSTLIPFVTGLFLLFFYLILTFLYSPILGLIIILSTGFNSLIVALNLRFLKDSSLQISKDSAKANSVIIAAVQEIESVKASAIENDVFKKYAGYQTRLLNYNQEISMRNARLRIIPSILNTFNEVFIIIVGFLLVLTGDLTLGMLLAAQTIALNLKSRIESVINFVQGLPTFSSTILRLEDVLEQPSDPTLIINESQNNFPKGRLKLSGKISIKDLTFGYIPLKEPLINHLNLEIEAGQRIALVGGSGSGKSTISKLISGLYQQNQGKILFDNYELTDIPRSIRTNSIALVQQDIQLYGCSVKDNLTLWNTEINDSLIKKSCQQAYILDEILKLPDGFDTILSEGGRNLSGGQRQRLEIARILISQPSILILDEATSALDAETEFKINQSFRRIGCTQIIIAHRLSTIRDADKILVFKNGEIVQEGKHLDMIKSKDSPYSQLINEM